MTARILDGKAVAKQIRLEVKANVAALVEASGVTPGLEVLLIGEDPASAVYVRNKERAAKRAGIRSVSHRMAADVSQQEVEALLDRLNADPEVDGILVQLPLPKHLDSRALLDRIDPAKDVDGFHPENVGRLIQKRSALVACTPAGVMQMLEREGIEVSGAHAVVVGRSDIVGKPMAALLLHANATVTTCHSRTRDLPGICSQADILIGAVGVLALLGADHVKPGAVVIDVGIHRIEDRATVERLFADEPSRLATFEAKGAVLSGDVDYHAVKDIASAITPVPGGVGPLTIAMLMANTLAAARARRG